MPQQIRESLHSQLQTSLPRNQDPPPQTSIFSRSDERTDRGASRVPDTAEHGLAEVFDRLVGWDVLET